MGSKGFSEKRIVCQAVALILVSQPSIVTHKRLQLELLKLSGLLELRIFPDCDVLSSDWHGLFRLIFSSFPFFVSI